MKSNFVTNETTTITLKDYLDLTELYLPKGTKINALLALKALYRYDKDWYEELDKILANFKKIIEESNENFIEYTDYFLGTKIELTYLE